MRPSKLRWFLLLCAVVFSLAIPAGASEALRFAGERPAARVYHAASTDSLVIGVLEAGTTVTVEARLDDFYRIDCYGEVGYIPAGQVALDANKGYYVNCSTDSETISLSVWNPVALQQIRADLLDTALQQEGTPYVFGGAAPGGFDCSGLVQYVYAAVGMDISRTAFPQLAQSVIVDPAQLRPGDLVFFDDADGSDDYITHVGIYIGDGMFLHAGSSGGVCVRALDNPYFAPRFQCARRLLLSTAAKEPPAKILTLN